jgi:hypothetical protein
MQRLVAYIGFCFLGATLCLPSPSFAQDATMPFQPGEKLTFELRWGFIPAGEAVLEVRPTKTINGVEAYHFVLTAKTNAFVDKIYKVRNRIDAFADKAMTKSVLFKHRQREGRRKKDIVVDFDWHHRQAQYSNAGRYREPIELMPGSFDPLSAFYYTRLLDFKKNTQVARPVTDGKKNIVGVAKVIRRETIELPCGTFDTYVVEPDLKHVGGVFRKSKNAKLHVWVTADERRIPVRAKSKVIVGSFVGELVSMRGLATTAQKPPRDSHGTTMAMRSD